MKLSQFRRPVRVLDEAVLRDPSGNRIKPYRSSRHRRFPPWRLWRRDLG